MFLMRGDSTDPSAIAYVSLLASALNPMLAMRSTSLPQKASSVWLMHTQDRWNSVLSGCILAGLGVYGHDRLRSWRLRSCTRVFLFYSRPNSVVVPSLKEIAAEGSIAGCRLSRQLFEAWGSILPPAAAVSRRPVPVCHPEASGP